MPDFAGFVRTFGFIALFIICVCAMAGCSGKSENAEMAAEEGARSMKAPDFSLPDLQGNTVELSDFRGKVLLVDFWATWCGPCRLEIPHLVELHGSYKDRGFEIVGIALDNKGPEVVAPFVEEHGVPYTIVIGNRDVAIAFGGLTAIPTAFMVDRNGTIVNKYVGYTEKAVFEEEIKRLLD